VATAYPVDVGRYSVPSRLAANARQSAAVAGVGATLELDGEIGGNVEVEDVEDDVRVQASTSASTDALSAATQPRRKNSRRSTRG
jgi:hypothetical protein